MRFYAISPPRDNLSFNKINFDKMSDILQFSFFQFRPKHKTLKNRIKFVKSHYRDIYSICKKKKIKIIINDDFEIAEKFKFDGIHLGQNDKCCSEAKKKFGSKFIVGVSCSNSPKLYEDAAKQNANYVAFGPVFQSLSKNKKEINLNNLSIFLKSLRLPFTLIGGINHNNIIKLLKFNPNELAVISAFWDYPDGPVKAAIKFREILRNNNSYEN